MGHFLNATGTEFILDYIKQAQIIKWENLLNKPAWANDEIIQWTDIANKPDIITEAQVLELAAETILQKVQVSPNKNNFGELVGTISVGDKAYELYAPVQVGKIDPNSDGGTGEIFNDYTGNKATGPYSHAEGYGTTATKSYSHAEGYGTQATEMASHAEGAETLASGDTSHAEGSGTQAANSYTHAEGYHTTASNPYEHAQGLYNKSNSPEDQSKQTIHSIGIGTEKVQKNAVEVLRGGDVFITGIGGYDGTNPSTASSIQDIVSSRVGRIDADSQGTGEIFNDYPENRARGPFSHAEGQGTSTTSDATASHAEGYKTTAKGLYSHAEGNQTTAQGGNSHAEGESTQAVGDNSHAEGNATAANGSVSHAEGANTSTAQGSSYSHAEGWYTQTNNQAEHAQGQYNVSNAGATDASKTIHSIGIGTSPIARKNAVEVMRNGDVYIMNIGGYDGTNYTSAKTLQESIPTDYSLPVANGTTLGGIKIGRGISMLNGDTAIAVGVIDTSSKDQTGEIFNDYTNNQASGNCSHAEGVSTKALNINAHAEGSNTTANGENSHAEGLSTLAYSSNAHAEGSNTTAEADSSHAEGHLTVAHGSQSHAEGSGTITGRDAEESKQYPTLGIGTAAHAEGVSTHAYGIASHASGINTITYGDYSTAEGSGSVTGSHPSGKESPDEYPGKCAHAEGEATLAAGIASHAEGKQANAIGNYSHAEGYLTVAQGGNSHAEGESTLARGNNSHAEGNQTKANGSVSHVEGASTSAAGDYSHAEGWYTQTNNRAEHAQGQYNVSIKSPDDSSLRTIHSIGIGTDDDARKNAVEVKFNGDVYVIGIGKFNGNNHSESETLQEVINSNTISVATTTTLGGVIIGDGLEVDSTGKITAVGKAGNASGGEIFNDYAGNKATGPYSHAEGQGTSAGEKSHAEGSETEASGSASHAEGGGSKAIGGSSHAEGGFSVAYGKYSHAEGNQSHAGKKNAESADSALAAHAEGYQTHAEGKSSHSEGYFTVASGDYSHSEGYQTTASGNCSHASGYNTSAGGYCQTVIGVGNIRTADSEDSYNQKARAFVIGNGASGFGDAFYVLFNGETHADGAYSSSGADYTEMFEWEDGNPNNEDRVGLFVTLKGKKIRVACKDDKYILGIISGSPTVVGNNPMKWHGKFILDEWGRPVYETIEYEGKPAIVPKLNPEYDSDKSYTLRTERKEWGGVGLMGQLLVRQDGSLEEGGFCSVADNGIATASETGYYVMEIRSKSQALIMFK